MSGNKNRLTRSAKRHVLRLCLGGLLLLLGTAGQSQTVRQDSLLERIFKFSSSDQARSISNFEARTYSKFHLQTVRKNAMMRLLPHSFKLERGNRNYVGENLTQINYLGAGHIDRKEIAFYSTMPRLRNLQDIILDNTILFPYEPSLMNDRLVSPFHSTNRKYYTYTIDSLFVEHTDTLCRISIIPKRYNVQLVSGKAILNLQTGHIREFVFETFYEKLLKLKIKVEMGSEGKQALLPIKTQLNATYGFRGNKVNIQIYANTRYIRIDTLSFADNPYAPQGKNKYDLSYISATEDTSNSQVIRDFHYFDRLRPIPLTRFEDSLYTHYENAASVAQSTHFKEKKSTNFFDPLEDIFLGSHNITLSEKGRLRIPPILTPAMFQWSGSKGLAIQTKMNLQLLFPKNHSVSFVPRIGYNFKNQLFYWTTPFHIMLFPSVNGKTCFLMGNGNRIYNSLQAQEIRQAQKGVENYDSLMNIFNRYNFNYYKDFYIRSDFEIEPLCGLEMRVGTVYHRRTLLHWNQFAVDQGMKRLYKSFAPYFYLSWTPKKYYYVKDHKRIPLYSNWPTFSTLYERGIRFRDFQNEYERWEFDMQYRYKMKSLRSFYIRLGGGFYTQQKQMYFVDYENFHYKNLPMDWEDETLGQFQLLDSKWYNESEYYALSCLAYESPMLLFSRIKLLNTLIRNERIYCNTLFVHALKPYIELGYGLNTNLLDMALFVGRANDTGLLVGGKVALRLFDNW